MSVKVFLEPTGVYSRAMLRVARALERYKPGDVEIVKRREDADCELLHHFQYPDQVEMARPSAVIQYCLDTSAYGLHDWIPYWFQPNCNLVWSYYDLHSILFERVGDDRDWYALPFMHAPLGIDDAFKQPMPAAQRDLIITTGYVHGPGAEAIEDVWNAASKCGIKGFHIGPPQVVNAGPLPKGWRAVEGISDEELASLYSRARYVAGLRYIEGLELPAAEGASCGAIPILFDQPATRYWHGHIAPVFLRESLNVEEQLVALFSTPGADAAYRVDDFDKKVIRSVFNWETIAEKFWNMVGW